MPIHYDKKEHIAYLTIDGAGELNPMSPPLEKELVDTLLDFRDDPDLWVAILTGAGDKAFTVGGDLKWILERGKEDFTPEQVSDRLWYPHSKRRIYGHLFNLFRGPGISKPIIAAVNGYCLGAGFMVLCIMTDIRIASENAKFGFSEMRHGLGAIGGATKLPLQIPHAVAMYMILTGNMIDAQKALQVGLVNEVVPLAELMPTAERIAKDICEIPPLAVMAEKEGTLRGLLAPRAEALRIHESLETVKRLEDHLRGGNPLEGVKAFRRKKKPKA